MSIAVHPPTDPGRRLFTFAAITDTHLNQGEDECSSPFEVNKLANARMRHVVRDLNTRDLAFVINVGDLIHPVPAMPDLYAEAAALFKQQVAELKHDLYLVPGNHDIGDKPNDWAPAAGICEDYLALWEEHFGPDYHSFDHDECHFVVINAQIINSGLAAEEAQREWLIADLDAHRGKRIFLNSHYPPYFSRPDEDANYDNIDEPGRSWMLKVMADYEIEALLIGHVHNFWFYRDGVTDCYLLPSTAFVRQDYSEMYRIPPEADAEAGRNDRPKLGYFLVHVHENGHLVEPVRTNGATLAPDAPPPPAVERVPPVHPRQNAHPGFGFDMRQDWMEIIEIPPTGGLDEFDRKEVRNDYPLLALWEMGVQRLRVPLRDLKVPGNRRRMAMLRSHGHEFTLSTFGAPTYNEMDLIATYQKIFSAWQIGYNPQSLDRIAPDIAKALSRVDLPLYLSKLRSIDEMRGESGRYYHTINQGFFPADADDMRALMARPDIGERVAGFVFRTTGEAEPWSAVAEAARCADELGVSATVHLRMMGGNPADVADDDHWVASRVAEAVAAAAAHDGVSVFCDTLADNDRGYFVRNGVLDRLWNPRLGYHVVRHLHGALHGCGALRPGAAGSFEGGRYVTLLDGAAKHVLVLPDATGAASLPPDLAATVTRRIDLASGEISDAAAPLPAHPVLISGS